MCSSDLVTLLASSATADEQPSPMKLSEGLLAPTEFVSRVRPFLTAHCVRCHGVEKQEEDGPARAEAADLVRQTDANAWVRLVMAEGRYREVRRMLERVGHPVMRLRRVAFAGLTTAGLKPGQWRLLTEAEIVQLRARGHVGAFELPPDPRREVVARQRPTKAPARPVPPSRPVAPKRPAPRAPAGRNRAAPATAKPRRPRRSP